MPSVEVPDLSGSARFPITKSSIKTRYDSVPASGRAKRNQPHRRLDAIHDHLLEGCLSRKARAIGECGAIMTQCRDPRASTVVILAPGDRMKVEIGRAHV